jgi:hypothetical protein
VLLALAGEFNGLHGQDLVIAHRVLGVYKGVLMWEVNLMMDEVSGGRDGLRDVGKHVSHRIFDASSVWAAVDPLAVLGECGEVDGFGCMIPAEVCQLITVS